MQMIVCSFCTCLCSQVNRRYGAGVQERTLESDRLYSLAHVLFHKSLLAAADDPHILHNFASNICAALRYDHDHLVDKNTYKQKVREGIIEFKRLGNTKVGVTEIRLLALCGHFTFLLIIP